MNNQKKAKERILLEKFKNAYPDFPTGDIEDTEEPDFLIGDVGIEITRFMHDEAGEGGSKARKNEHSQKTVIEKAKTKFEGKVSTPYVVIFSWRRNAELNSKNIEAVATELADLIEKVTEHGTQHLVYVDKRQISQPSLIPLIDGAAVRKLDDGAHNAWSGTDGSLIGISQKQLALRISEKNPKLAAYKKQCKTVWLVIVADGETLASMADLNEDSPQMAIETEFDRVFFFNARDRKIVRLPIKH